MLSCSHGQRMNTIIELCGITDTFGKLFCSDKIAPHNLPSNGIVLKHTDLLTLDDSSLIPFRLKACTTVSITFLCRGGEPL